MTLSPSPCDIDVMLASEWLEAGRAIMNGYVTPERTTLIASTHRIYTVLEKMQMGDGRYDSARVTRAAGECARRAILADFEALALRAGTLISAVLFGALAGSGVLPVSRAACENAIRAGGRGTEASLRGFALGFEAAAGGTAPGVQAAKERPAEPGSKPGSLQERIRSSFPAAAHTMLEEGVKRVADFHDGNYAALYLDRMQAVAQFDRAHGATGEHILTCEAARFLALWMSYEDVIRVADLKSRKSRFELVRKEVQAKPHEPLHIIEYLKPGVEEVAALLPPALSKRLLAWTDKRGLTHKLNVGMHIKSSSVSGFLLLRLLASLKPLRRMSARFAEEQAMIQRWLGAIVAAPNAELALEIALCGRLIKGYGDTNRRGKANFLRIFDTLVEGKAVADASALTVAVRAAREAALSDAEGRSLEKTLAGQGIAPLPPKPRPMQFMRRPSASKAA